MKKKFPIKTLLAERRRHPIRDRDNVVSVVANAPIANAVCLKSVRVANPNHHPYWVSDLRFDSHGDRHRYNLLASICGDDPDLTEIVMVSFADIVVTSEVTVVLPEMVMMLAELVD